MTKYISYITIIITFIYLISTININASTDESSDENSRDIPTVLFFGDSCTAGFVSDSGKPILTPDASYPSIFEKNANVKVYNYAVGGATMSSRPKYIALGTTFSQQIDIANKENTLSNANYIFINFGINDHLLDIPIESTNSRYELNEEYYLDAFNLGLNKIRNMSQAKIIVIIPHYSTRELNNLPNKFNTLGLSLNDYREALISRCKEIGIDIIDFRECGLNLNNSLFYYNGDPAHLTTYGYQLQGEYLSRIWDMKYANTDILLHKKNNLWYCYKKNAGNEERVYIDGIINNNGDSWYVKNGCLQNNFTGFIQDKGEYLYALNGKVLKNYTGLIRSNNTTWQIIINGRLSKDYTGLIPNAGYQWYCENGKLNCSYSGIYGNGNAKWFIVNGKLDPNYIGVRYDINLHKCCYVYKGVVRTDLTGFIKHNNKFWYCENGFIKVN